MLLSEAVPAVLFLGLLTLVPDTPRWYVMKGRVETAQSVLARLVGDAEARLTIKEIENSLIVPKHPTGASLFAFGSLVIVAGIMLSVFQQFVGIKAVLYYAPLMFKNLGASTDSALLQTVIVGLANVVFTLVAILTVGRLGRKPLLIVGGFVMGVAMVTLGFQFQASAVGTGPLISAVAYIAGFALSWGPVTWVLLSEMAEGKVFATLKHLTSHGQPESGTNRRIPVPGDARCSPASSIIRC